MRARGTPPFFGGTWVVGRPHAHSRAPNSRLRSICPTCSRERRGGQMARPRRWVSRCTSRSRRRRRRSVSPRVSPRTPSFPTAPSISPHPRSRCVGDNAPGGQGERCRPPWSRRWRRRGAAPALARRRMRRLSACDYRAPSAAAAAGAIGETRCALSARGGEKEGRGGGALGVSGSPPLRAAVSPPYPPPDWCGAGRCGARDAGRGGGERWSVAGVDILSAVRHTRGKVVSVCRGG